MERPMSGKTRRHSRPFRLSIVHAPAGGTPRSFRRATQSRCIVVEYRTQIVEKLHFALDWTLWSVLLDRELDEEKVPSGSGESSRKRARRSTVSNRNRVEAHDLTFLVDSLRRVCRPIWSINVCRYVMRECQPLSTAVQHLNFNLDSMPGT